MYIDNEKEKHLQDINAALREVDHLNMMIEMEEKKKVKRRKRKKLRIKDSSLIPH